MRIYRNEDSNQVIFEGVEVQSIPCNVYQAEIVEADFIRISDKTSPDNLRIINKVLFSEILDENGNAAGADVNEVLNYVTRQLNSNLSTSVYNAGRLEGLYLSVENNGDNIKVTPGKSLVLVGDTLREVILETDFIFNLSDVTPNGNDKVFSVAMTGDNSITVTEIAGALNGAAIPADIRTESFLGIFFYNDFFNKFTFVQTLAPTAKNVGSTVYDLVKALNPKVLPSDRPIITKSTASDMRLGIGSGRVFAFGSNLITGTDTDPNIFEHPANTDIQYLQIAEPNGAGLWQINQLGQLLTFAGDNIWTKYDDGSGALQDTPDDHWVLMPVTLNCGQIQQGPVLALPTVYASQKAIPDSTFRLNLEVEAVNALQTFKFPNLTLETSAIIGVIAMRKDASNLADTDKVKIFSGDAEYLTAEGLTRVFQAIENVPIYDIYVSEGANPTTATGSISNPYNNLSDAVAAVSSGGSIFIDGSIAVSSQTVLPNKSISFFGSSDAEIKYTSYDATNGNIISHDGDNTAKFDFENITFRNAGGYALLIKKSEEVNIRNCEFYNNGWNGQALNTVLPSSTSGLLGFDSTNTDLQTFYAGSNASNGGAVRLEECRKPLIRESRAEANLRAFRLQDCGINGGGFVIENQAIGNIESGFYLAAGSLSGCQNITVAVNYSAYNANNGLLVIGGLNNKFSQNEVNGNWNAGLCAWGAANTTLRDCGLYDNNRSQYNGIGNTGDAIASIQINEAYSYLGDTISLNSNARFIAEILDTQVHYTGLGSNTDKIGVLITEDVGLLASDAKNIIKIDDVGFIGQDYAIDFSEVDLTNLKVSLGDNSYQLIGEKAVRPPLSGTYFELPYSNHVTNINYIDFEVNNTGGIIVKEGINGNVINPYQVNQLQAVAYNSKIRIVLKDSNKIQFEIPVANTSINGTQVNSILNIAITQLNDLFTNTQGFSGQGNPVTDFTLTGNDLTITLEDSTTFTVDVTALGVDENKFVSSGAINGTDLELTMNDNSIVSIDISSIANGLTPSFAPDIANQSFDIEEGQPFNVQIALNSDSDIVNQFGEEDAPSWAVLNQSTGVFIGTAPAFGGSNTYVINCKAANAIGGVTNFTITLNVIEPVYTNTKSLRFQDGVSSYLGGNAALVTALERNSNGSGSAEAWTIAFWFKGSSNNSGQTLFYFGGNVIQSSGHIELRQTNNSGQKRLRFRYGTTFNYLQLTTPNGSINPNVFQHVLISYNGGTTGPNSNSVQAYYSRFKIYIDGVLQTTNNAHQNFGYSGGISGQNYRFGRYNSGQYPKNLLLNQFCIWNSDQSSNVAGLYNGGATQDISALAPGVGAMNTNYLPPDHYYEIEDSVTTIEDLAGTAHFIGYNFNSSDLVTDAP